MAQQTDGNLKLLKPELTDSFRQTIGTDLPDNFQKIDDAVSDHELKKASVDNVHGLRDSKVAIGDYSMAIGSDAVAIGKFSQARGGSNVALGVGASTDEYYAYALGNSAAAEGICALAIGYTADAKASSTIAIGRYAFAANERQGVLGGAEMQQLTTYDWLIPGNLTVSGTKDFEIQHPHPDKKDTHMLRHGCVESPSAGENLYRFKVTATENNQTVELELPDYFQYLNKNVDVWVNGHKHFGRSYGEVEGNTLKITCELAGEYKCLVIGTRNDDNLSVQNWDIKGVEREIGESWYGETHAFEIPELFEVEEIKEVA